MSGSPIGLFGGSFDPPHLGHMALVQAGLDAGLEKIYVIPALPVHRTLSGHADGRTRLEWLVRIFADQPQVQVVDWEVRQNQPTPAIATLRYFRHLHPHTAPWLMLGADAWAGLPGWREYPAHRSLCNVAVFARCGAMKACGHEGWRQLAAIDKPVCSAAGHWMYIEADLPDISATELRRHAQSGRSLDAWTPAAVCREIEQAYGRAYEIKPGKMETM